MTTSRTSNDGRAHVAATMRFLEVRIGEELPKEQGKGMTYFLIAMMKSRSIPSRLTTSVRWQPTPKWSPEPDENQVNRDELEVPASTKSDFRQMAAHPEVVTRAIAVATGSARNTVLKELAQIEPVGPDRITGINGKSYSSTQPPRERERSRAFFPNSV